MATSEVVVERSDAHLKHLNFVRILAINAVVVVSNLYEYAKQNSGPLKSTAGKVEDAAAALLGPVYHRFKSVPSHILVFLDKKVDEVSYILDDCAPPAAKAALSKAQTIFKKASDMVQDLAEEAKEDGPVAAISHAGQISKDLAVSQMAIVWYKANQHPALHGVLEMFVPTATHWSQKYNSLVKDLTAKGYSVFSYVPLVPVEEMEKAYKQVESAASKKTDTSRPNSSNDSE